MERIVQETRLRQIIKLFRKVLYSAKNTIRGLLAVFTIHFSAEHLKNQDQGDALVTLRTFGKTSEKARREAEKLSELSGKDKSF